MQTEDRQLIRHVLAGSTKDFGLLLRRHAPRVRRFIGRMVTNREDAEELTQNVFVKAYGSLVCYDEVKSDFTTWLQRIAYHEAVDYLRHGDGERPLSLDSERGFEQVSDEEVDTPFDDMRVGRVELLKRAILTLPHEDQLLLQLYYNDGKALKDISFILDRQPDYLATRLQRIRKRLHKTIRQLEKHEKD